MIPDSGKAQILQVVNTEYFLSNEKEMLNMNLFFALLFSTMLVGVAFGDAVILGSNSSGEFWRQEDSGCLYSLNSVAVDLASGRAVAVGDRGSIIFRDDEGSWINVSPDGFEADLNSVAFGVNGVCLACGDGGVLLSSFDRGESWRLVEEIDFSWVNLLSVNFDPTHSGDFVVTGENGFLFSSRDGGSVDTESNNPFPGSFVRLCSGYPAFAVSVSGEVISLSGKAIPGVNSNSEINGGTVVVSGGSQFTLVGDNGLILTLEDDWVAAPAPVDTDLNSVAAVSFGSVLCAVGDNGTIIVSRDNGDNWESVSSGTLRNLNCVAGDGAGRAFIVGDAIFSEVLFP